MSTVWRLLAAIAAFFGTFLLILVPGLALFGSRYGIGTLPSFAAGLAAARYVWLHGGSASRSIVGNAVTGAILLGGVGFAAGFFGPLIFTPQANQGPLLGIFITGPAGVVIGALGGLVRGWVRSRPEADHDQGGRSV